MNRLLAYLFVFSLLLSLVACGGSGGGGGGTTTGGGTTPVRFSLRWGERSRATAGPSSALSATLTVAGAAEGGGNVIQTVNRVADLGAYTADYTTDAGA